MAKKHRLDLLLPNEGMYEYSAVTTSLVFGIFKLWSFMLDVQSAFT